MSEQYGPGNRKLPGEKRRNVQQSFAQILQFSLYMLVPICGMSALGFLLDRKFGTSWIMILGFFVGAVAGFQNIYRYAMKIIRGSGEEGKGAEADPPEDKDESSH